MKTRKLAAITALAMGGGLAVAGCGSSPSTTSAPPPAKPQSGGTIVAALPPQTELNWFFPLMDGPSDSLYNAQIQSMMYKPLIALNTDGSINYQRSLAASITPNAAGTVYTVTLHPTYKWSNGQPVTTTDVLFTWHLIQGASASNAPSPWPYVGAGSGDIPAGVKSVTADGPYKFTVTLNQPANQQWFIYNGLSQLTPIPEAVWNKYPTDMNRELTYIAGLADTPTAPEYKVVDGPFKLAAAVPSQHWVFVPNPTYGGHKPYVSKLIFQYVTSDTAEFAALRTGTIQVGYLPHALYGSRSALAATYKFTPIYFLGYNDVLVNMNHGHKNAANNAPNGVGDIFDQLYVRQAMQMGINQPAIAKAAFQGNAETEVGVILPKPKTVFYDPNLKVLYPYDPARGKKLLEAHGWKEVNGVMTKGTQKLEFTMVYTSGSNAFTQQATLIQQGLAQEGIKLTLEPKPFSSIIALSPNQWDMQDYGGISFGGSYPTGGALFKTPGVGLNSQGYYNPTMVSLIDKSHLPYKTQAESLQALYNYEAFVAKDLPVLWTPYPAQYVEVAKTVHGVVASENPFTQGITPQYWWVGK